MDKFRIDREGNIIEFLTKEEKVYKKVLMTGEIYSL